MAEKRGLLGLYKVINDLKVISGLRTFGVLHLKLKRLPNKMIQLLSCRFSECILHGMLQNDCTHNLSSECLLPYTPVFLVTKLAQVNNTSNNIAPTAELGPVGLQSPHCAAI